MATIVRTERRKRGIIGWFFLLVFLAFNALMLAWLIGAGNLMGESAAGLTSDAEKAGHAIGAALGVGMILSIWAAGDIILGLFVLLTKGRKTIIETTAD